MATNRDLLKEAIADAKAVKETAIANAKAALEEAFTPFLKEKLSAKLAEMEENDVYEETELEKEERMMEEEDMANEEISLDELLAELESEEESLYEAEEEEEGEEEEGEEEEMSIEDMSEDDLKSFIEDVIKDMVSAGELEAGHEGMENEEGAEEIEAGEEEEIDEEINIDELLAEIEEGSLTNAKGKDEYVTDKTEEDDTPISKSKAQKLSFEKDVNEVADLVFGLSDAAMALLTGAFGAGLAAQLVRVASKDKKAAEAIKKITGETPKPESKEMEEQLAELQSELNEVNLLNAKLLYTNKIFRNKSLNETQKVKVLTAFDKATTKKEVELVYETLLESLKVTTKAPIKESMGSASKVLGSATSKPIIENDAFARMRELAFGKNK